MRLFSHHSNQNHKRGFTLTEIAIVMGIIGVMISAIWVTTSKVATANKVTKSVQMMLALTTGARELFPNGSAPGISDVLMIRTGVVTAESVATCTVGRWTINPEGCMYTPWKQEVIIGAQGWSPFTAADNQFEIVIDSMPNSICAPFLAGLVPYAMQLGLIAVAFNDTGAVTYVTPDTNPTAFSACDGSGELNLLFRM